MVEGHPHDAGSDYRPCVAMVMFDGNGRVFVAERSDLLEAAWQVPQGGIDDGESAAEAARRELAEEIGTTAADVLGEAPGWITYDWPAGLAHNPLKGRYRGQAVKLVALRFTGRNDDIDLDTETPEFRAWRWVELEELPEMIVPFKRPLYEAAVEEFSPIRDTIRRAAGW